MFTFAKTEAKRVVLSSLGAIALTAATIGGVASPAHAAPATASIESWQQVVETKLDTMGDRYSLGMESGRSAAAVLAVRFTAEGDYAGATVARSSGNPALDAHALKVAARIAYPQLPDGYRGRPQTVAMRLVFGRADTAQQMADMQDVLDRDLRVARNDAGTDAARGGKQVAAR